MIKRPLDSRFSDAVRQGRKFTTIRDNPWPVGKPIMLYNWSGKPYRSPQINVTPVEVVVTQSIDIQRCYDDAMAYRYPCNWQLWEGEGFNSQSDMDDWFRSKLKPGQIVTKSLMRFRIVNL